LIAIHSTIHPSIFSFPYSYFFLNNPPSTSIYTLFPTRRSSDLSDRTDRCVSRRRFQFHPDQPDRWHRSGRPGGDREYHLRSRLLDRKSTRLNSSHGSISYAVFCLKKKK